MSQKVLQMQTVLMLGQCDEPSDDVEEEYARKHVTEWAREELGCINASASKN